MPAGVLAGGGCPVADGGLFVDGVELVDGSCGALPFCCAIITGARNNVDAGVNALKELNPAAWVAHAVKGLNAEC